MDFSLYHPTPVLQHNLGIWDVNLYLRYHSCEHRLVLKFTKLHNLVNFARVKDDELRMCNDQESLVAASAGGD